MSGVIKEQIEDFTECPECKSVIPIHIGYITWCECGYNLSSHKEERKKSKIDRLYERLGEKYGQFVFNKMTNKEAIKPGMTMASGLALFVATCVHILSLAAFLFGLYLLIFQSSHFMSWIWGFLLIGVSWFTRPRVQKLEKNERIIPREEIPATYGVLEDLAASMGVKKIDGIIMNEEYNASIMKIGWKRRTIVRIGIPYFAALTPEEQCSVLAHELGHYLNKDLTYTGFVSIALTTLYEWYSLLEPVPSEETFEFGLIDMITNFVQKILAQIPFLFYSLLLHLIWINSQIGEYLADYRAAQICGSRTVKNDLEKPEYGRLFMHTLSKVSVNNLQTNVIDEFKMSLSVMPEREKKRYQLQCSLEKFQLDATHPPTTYRIQFIDKQNLPGTFILDPVKANKMLKELEAKKDSIHEAAVENYRYHWLN